MRLYLIVNFIFFLSVPLLNTENLTLWQFDLASLSEMPPDNTVTVERRIENWPGDGAAYRALFDQRVATNQAAFLFVMIPLIGFPMWLTVRRRRFLAEHLLFVTGQMTFVLVTLFACGLLALLLQVAAPPIVGERASLAAVTVAVGAWSLLVLIGFIGGARRFYRLRWHTSLIVGLFTCVCAMVAVWIYGKLLFWYTLLTLRP